MDNIAAYSDGFKTHWYFYAPVGVTWFLTGFIQDNEVLEGILRRLVVLSVLGPFWMQWQDFVAWLWRWNDDADLFYYLYGAAWFSAIIIEEIIQILLIPQVVNHLGGDYEHEHGDLDRFTIY